MATAAFKRRRVDPERVKSAARKSLATTTVKTDYVLGQSYEVPLKRVRPNPLNARSLYSAKALEKFTVSMRDNGQQMAATGFVDSDGDVVLIEGERRRRSAELLGMATLRVEIRPAPVSQQQLYLASRMANVERADQSPLDDAFSWRRLLDRKVFPSQVALAKALSISESEMSRTLALADMPVRLAQALAETPELLTLKMLNALREYFKLCSEDDAMAFLLDVSKEGLSYREVEARRKALESGPQPRRRAEKHELSYRGATGIIRSFNNDGRVEVSLKGLKPEDAAEVVTMISKLFEKGSESRGISQSESSPAARLKPQSRPARAA